MRIQVEKITTIFTEDKIKKAITYSVYLDEDKVSISSILKVEKDSKWFSMINNDDYLSAKSVINSILNDIKTPKELKDKNIENRELKDKNIENREFKDKYIENKELIHKKIENKELTHKNIENKESVHKNTENKELVHKNTEIKDEIEKIKQSLKQSGFNIKNS